MISSHLATFTQGAIPRFGHDPTFRHPLDGRGNANLCAPFDCFDTDQTAFVFVSHRWLTPRPGRDGHPDNAAGDSWRLITEACRKLRGPSKPIPPHLRIAIWIDFACINQDAKHPPDELLKDHARALLDAAASAAASEEDAAFPTLVGASGASAASSAGASSSSVAVAGKSRAAATTAAGSEQGAEGGGGKTKPKWMRM